MKIKLTDTSDLEQRYDLEKLLSDAVPTAQSDLAVPTAKRTNTVPTASTVPTVNSVPTAGKYDRYHQAYPESVKVPLKKGTISLLKGKAQELGFGSMSKLIRSALRYALSHDDFSAGWHK